MELDLESQCWLFFSLLKGVGPRKISRLLSEFSTLTEVVNADRSRLRQLGLNSEQISAVDDFVCAREPELYRQHRDRVQTWLQHPSNTLLHQKHAQRLALPMSNAVFSHSTWASHATSTM